jgi:hypothetical protein
MVEAGALLPAIIAALIALYALKKLKLLTIILFTFLGLLAAYAVVSLVPELQVEPLWPLLRELVESFPAMVKDVWDWFEETFGMVT